MKIAGIDVHKKVLMVVVVDARAPEEKPARRRFVTLPSDKSRVHIEVRDQGKGISPERLAEIQTHGSGVGIAGIRERLHRFRGEMKIESYGSGTVVSAKIPIPNEAPLVEFEPHQATV